MNGFKKFLAGFALSGILVFLIAATSGNIQWTQIRSSDRHGSAGTKGQSSDGTGTNTHGACYNSTGDLTDCGGAPGTGTVSSIVAGPCLQGGTITTTGTISSIGSCYVAGGGTANAQTATYSPAIGSLITGLNLYWLPSNANSTTPTFSPNSLTAKTLVKVGGATLVANDLTTTAIAHAIYDGTNWELQNPQTGSGTSGPPSGSAGGDLTGTYPNPGVGQVNGAAVPTSAVVTKTNSSKQFLAAVAADIVSLFSTCSGTQYLGADGACHTPGGGLTLTGTPSCTSCTSATGSIVLTGTTATVAFTAIPGTFNNLKLVIYGRTAGASANDNVLMTINSDVGTNYDGGHIVGCATGITGASTNSGTNVAILSMTGSLSTANFSGGGVVEIPAYVGTTNYKSIVGNSTETYSGGGGCVQVEQYGGMWHNTAAITRLDFINATAANFAAGTSFYLYGY